MSGDIDDFLEDILGLTKLSEFLPTLIWSFLAFLSIHQVLAPVLSKIVAPTSYGTIKNKRSRNTWNIHVTSQCHVLVIVPLAFWCIRTQAENSDWNEQWNRAFRWDDRAGFANAISAGYFLWDSLDAVINFIDTGYVIHGLACLMVYVLSFKPFVSYYAVRCLLWESSTFFLNTHWFLDKTNHTGSIFQLVNGFCLLAAFFCIRIVYGGWVSYSFFITLRHVYDDVPFFYTIVFSVGTITLQGLNWYWFMKIIAALRKRFEGQSAESARLIGSTNPEAPNGT